MSGSSARKIREGMGSAARPLAKDLLALDSVQSSPVVTDNGNFRPEGVRVKFERYYDLEYARREYEKIFLRTWQLAAREEDIPKVGDRAPFNVGSGSFLLVRSGPEEFKAFFNSCRHRGTMLCAKKESGDSIRCPVHGWEWKVDGTLSKIPSWWDFPEMTRMNGGLREVRVARWGGFIFINADPDAPSLVEELGPIPAHFASYETTNRYTALRLRKLLRANWKVGQETFQEAYHVTETHTLRAAVAVGDTQSKYDIWKSGPRQVGVGRVVTPSGIPSMNAAPDVDALTSATIWGQAITQFLYPGEQAPQFRPTGDLRKQMADWHRAIQLKRYNRVVTSPDTVMIDVDVYFLFPNTLLHLSEFLPYAFTFTPHPTDPEMCLMDLRVLLPCPVGQLRPAAVDPIEIGPDELVPDKAPQFDFQAHVIQQDVDNMERIQKGVKAADPRNHFSHLGLYQEAVIRHWHATYDEYMAR